ncbi:putative pyridine nucleotide-disulfide oxidoreductase RclA [Purpureocillium lavendulum]|uniref:Pyridine nucleotide-disulfide oxidoreductase RclA n=1 Tax=Purpureocillium lavendulum TaxID=1247861 RepID=A0AB34FGU5_9HYPO|nr:putative pyridine nucleotide-disulfide oxidoreductase RclA [Purpureocillium lavendulum]
MPVITARELILALRAYRVSYNLFLHPLRRFPGPCWHRSSRLPVVTQLWRGKLVYHLQDLHARYGPVVRTAPDELSFLDTAAWKDIYGRRVSLPSGLAELPKWQRFYRLHDTKGQTTIMNAEPALHTLLRRQLAPGFSERSMREQEGIISGYVDLLLRGLRQKSGSVVDMRTWFTWTSFDIIGDLTLGSSFGCLETQKWHPLVTRFSGSSREFTFISGLRMLGWDWLVGMIMSIGMPTRKKILGMTAEMLSKRRQQKGGRPDLIESMLGQTANEQLDFEVVHGTARSLLLAGAETTATMLCGVTFLLLTNPQVLHRVKEEVRSAFSSEKEITLATVKNLTYTPACLKEALRLYPPIPVGLPRYTPPGGAVIAGNAVPENTVVYVPHVAMYRSPTHWTNPHQYRPERFLGDAEYSKDDLEALQPFSVGPRSCIGMNLAFAEMNLILARIIFSFDLELSTESWLKRLGHCSYDLEFGSQWEMKEEDMCSGQV